MFLVWFQGVHPCDRRSSITKYRELFPAVDFSLACLLTIFVFRNYILKKKKLYFVFLLLYSGFFILFCFHIFSYSFCLQVETDEDVLWKPEIREEDKDLAARGVKFMNWWISATLLYISIYLIGFFFFTQDLAWFVLTDLQVEYKERKGNCSCYS